MSYIIHFNLSDFIDALQIGSNVYIASFTESFPFEEIGKREVEAVVILTSDAGLLNGPVHGVRLVIQREELSIPSPSTLEDTSQPRPSKTASRIIHELLTLKRMTSWRGILLTENILNELRTFTRTGITNNIETLEKLLAEETEKQPKTSDQGTFEAREREEQER